MAKYEPPVTTPSPTGGRLKPPPSPIKAPAPLPTGTLAPFSTQQDVTVAVEKAKKKKRADEEITLEDVKSATLKSFPVAGQMALQAPGAMVGLAAGLIQPMERKDRPWYEQAISYIPIVGSKTGQQLAAGMWNTITGDNARAAYKSLQMGESPLPYMLEDAGNLALGAAGVGAAAKGVALTAESAGVRAAAESVAKQSFRVARLADTISDAPIVLPTEIIGKGVNMTGRFGRARANALRIAADAAEAVNPRDPIISMKRSQAAKLDSYFGKEVFIDGVARTITNKAMRKFTTRVLRRTSAASDAVGRSFIKIVDEPLYRDDINPATGETYGPLRPEEQQAVTAILNGRARLINELMPRLNKTAAEIAELGRYRYAPGAALTPEGAQLAVDFLNGRVDEITGQRLANAAERLSRELEDTTQLAREGYGRRRALEPMYDIPLPEPTRLAQRLREAGRADMADVIDELVGQGFFDEVLAGNFDTPAAQDALTQLQLFVEQSPDQIALDPSIYPPKERNNVAFYGRIREALLAEAAATAGGAPPGAGYPGGRPTPMDEGPATGLQPESFYTGINAPGAFSRMPERYLRNSIKQLERLRGRARQLGEKVVQIELSIRNLEFKIIKASLRIEALEGFYTDANGNRLMPDEQGMYPPDAVYVPGLIEKLIAKRDAARAELARMRAEQADTTVIDGKVHSADQVEQMVTEAEQAVAAVEAGIAELEAEISDTTDQINQAEVVQADAANALQDMGENPDALLEAAAADAESIPGDPEAFLQPDDGAAAIESARADVEAARRAQTAARNVELEARAKITDLEARYRDEQAKYAAEVAKQEQKAVAGAEAPSREQVLEVLNRLADQGAIPTKIVKAVEKAYDTTFVEPKPGASSKAVDRAVFSSKDGGLGGYRAALVNAVDGNLWYTDSYMAVIIDPTSKFGQKLAETGNQPGVYRTTATGRSAADMQRAQMSGAGEMSPNIQQLVDRARPDAALPPATVIGVDLPATGSVVVLQNADGTTAGVALDNLNKVYEAGDTLHFSDPAKPITVVRNGQIVGIVMPIRGDYTPITPDAVYQKLREGQFGSIGPAAAELDAIQLASATRPRLKQPKRPTITPDDLDAATTAWNDAQEAVRVADQALREAEGQLYAVEKAAPAARLTPPSDIATAIGEPGARPWDFVEATPEQTMVDQELPVFKKKYGKDKTIYVRVNAEGNTVILFDGYRKKNFVYADNGFELTLQPGATVADALQAMDEMRYFIDDETPVIFYGSGGVSQNRLASFRANRAGEKSPTALRAQKQMREAFSDLYTALQNGELPVRPAKPLLSAPRAAILDAQGRAAEAAANIEAARAEDGDVAAAVAEYDAAVAEVQALEAGVEVGPIEAAAAPPPPETVTTTAANELDWQKQSDGSYTINTGSRRYAALKVDVTPPGAKKKRTTWALKRYGSDGEIIEGATQVFPNFKAARDYVQEQMDADGLDTGQRYIYRPGRELGPGPGVETPIPLLAAERAAERATLAVESAQARLENLRTQVEKNTARIDKLRVDEAANRAKLTATTAAAVRTEARLAPEIYTQPDVVQFAGQARGVPMVGQALTPSGVPVMAGEGMPATLRPTSAVIRKVDEQIQQVYDEQAAAGVPVEQRPREVSVVEKSVNEALLRRRASLPPTLPVRVALAAPREIAQPFIGSQYIPVGRKAGSARGARTTVEAGLTGDLLLRSERRRTGMGDEIYDIVELGRVIAGERRQMELNEGFKALLNSQFALTPEELLGRDTVARLETEAYDRAWRESEGGWAAYAPGVRSRDAVFEKSRREILGNLIDEEMNKRGFETLPEQGYIGGRVSDLDIEGTTKYLPVYAKERIMERRIPQVTPKIDAYLNATSRFTSAFKNVTLPLSVIWQIGDLAGVFWSAAVTGVNPITMADYMIQMLRDNYGGPEATRMDILRNIFKDPEHRRVGELADLLSGSGIQDTGLRIQESRRFRGQDPGAEPQTIPQRLLTRYTPDLPRPTLAGGKLGVTRGNVGNLFPAYRKGAYRVNEAINRVGRHAYFLAKLGEELNNLNARMGTNYTIEQVGELGLHERPGPIRDAWENAIDSANEVMGDWLDLTPFERKYVLPHLTFYAWTKHIHKLFAKVAKENPAAIKWQLYLGSLAYDPEADPLELMSSYIPTPGGGLAGSNFLNPFGDIVEGPLGTLVLQKDPSRLFTGVSPLPRILTGAITGRNLAKGLEPISRQYGTGEITRTGKVFSPPLITRPTELLGYAAQQFPIGTKLLDIMPAGQLPGTSIQTGPFERYDTGQARFKPMTAKPVPKFGGRLLTAARLLTLPGVPTTSIEKMKDIERRAEQRLRAFETAKKLAEARSG